jgi:hypothetical protein
MRTAPAYDFDSANAEWVNRVQPACPEQVLTACPFSPPRNEVAGRAAGLGGRVGGGLLGGFLARKGEQALNSRAAGGLPQNFALAITPTHVRAYEVRYGGRALAQVGQEVAAWERSGLFVTRVDRGQMKTNVTLQPPSGGEILCSAGTHAFTDRFIEMLRDRP